MEFCTQEKQEGRPTCLDGGSRGLLFESRHEQIE